MTVSVISATAPCPLSVSVSRPHGSKLKYTRSRFYVSAFGTSRLARRGGPRARGRRPAAPPPGRRGLAEPGAGPSAQLCTVGRCRPVAARGAHIHRITHGSRTRFSARSVIKEIIKYTRDSLLGIVSPWAQPTSNSQALQCFQDEWSSAWLSGPTPRGNQCQLPFSVKICISCTNSRRVMLKR